ncbi:glycosyltransferase [Candidatus Soleaferrea massiliensis]|uniref:glycosyltransferase n=1 Tax=Candidatus Soleaferrea massiliensis TaxID=1470354 RepID=UPI0018CE7C3D|nr:glycosyltransferase [Candidatus Soleaferrea massiliensis]
MDCFDQLNNGTSMTAYRFADTLRKNGHEVRVVTAGTPGKDKYIAKEKHWPIASWFAHRQGFAFAKSDKDLFRRAFEGADVVHFLLSLPFECCGAKIAREMGIPASAAFHLQPQNITYNIHCSRMDWLSRSIYRLFNRTFYKNFDHIHCPSQFIADQLVKNGYQAKLHVISNGVDDDFVPLEDVKKPDDGLFHILMVGRLSPEKRQTVLLKAAALSKYADRIQLHLAGRGPMKHRLMRMGHKLKHPPVIGFYSKEDLIRLENSCDLYVHASVIEIEAISCMEAFSCGLVPVICNAQQSATPQFALDGRSLFIPDDPVDLARKIDYWIEHPDEKEQMSKAYAEEGNLYRIEQSIRAAERMFEETVRDYHAKHRNAAEVSMAEKHERDGEA